MIQFIKKKNKALEPAMLITENHLNMATNRRESPRFLMTKTLDVSDFARTSPLVALGGNISPVLEKTLTAAGDNLSHFTYEEPLDA